MLLKWFLILSTAFAMETYICDYDYSGKYDCKLISEPAAVSKQLPTEIKSDFDATLEMPEDWDEPDMSHGPPNPLDE